MSNVTLIKCILVSNSGYSWSVCSKGMIVMTYHREWVTLEIAIEGIGTIAMQICNAFCENKVSNKDYTLIMRD